MKTEQTQKLKAFFARFPDNATSWAQATDELADMHNYLAEEFPGYKGNIFVSAGGKLPDAVKQSPAVRNTLHKKAILDLLPQLNATQSDAFFERFFDAKGALIEFTEAEDRAYDKWMSHFLNNGLSDIKAEAETLKQLKNEFPRLVPLMKGNYKIKLATGGALIEFTEAEDRAYDKWMSHFLNNGLTDLKAEAETLKVLKNEFPRLVPLMKGNYKIKLATGGAANGEKTYYSTWEKGYSWQEFLETEVSERGNYSRKEVNAWKKKYNIPDHGKVLMWVATSPQYALQYAALAESKNDTQLELAEFEKKYGVSAAWLTEVSENQGTIITESEDGENGYLMVLNEEFEAGGSMLRARLHSIKFATGGEMDSVARLENSKAEQIALVKGENWDKFWEDMNNNMLNKKKIPRYIPPSKTEAQEMISNINRWYDILIEYAAEKDGIIARKRNRGDFDEKNYEATMQFGFTSFLPVDIDGYVTGYYPNQTKINRSSIKEKIEDSIELLKEVISEDRIYQQKQNRPKEWSAHLQNHLTQALAVAKGDKDAWIEYWRTRDRFKKPVPEFISVSASKQAEIIGNIEKWFAAMQAIIQSDQQHNILTLGMLSVAIDAYASGYKTNREAANRDKEKERIENLLTSISIKSKTEVEILEEEMQALSNALEYLEQDDKQIILEKIDILAQAIAVLSDAFKPVERIKSSFESNVEALVHPETGMAATIAKMDTGQTEKEAFLKSNGMTFADYKKLDQTAKEKIQKKWVNSEEFKSIGEHKANSESNAWVNWKTLFAAPEKFMNYSGQYLYPPRIENKLQPSSLAKLDTGDYVGQPKLNGSNTSIALSATKATVKNRHDEFFAVPPKFDFVAMHSGDGWMSFAGEFMNKSKLDHNKQPFRGFCIWDIMAYDGQILIGSTIIERIALLDLLYPKREPAVVIEGITVLFKTDYPDIYRVNDFHREFETVYKIISKIDMVEGFVMKRTNGKLENMTREANNTGWAVKVRKPTKNYHFWKGGTIESSQIGTPVKMMKGEHKDKSGFIVDIKTEYTIKLDDGNTISAIKGDFYNTTLN